MVLTLHRGQWRCELANGRQSIDCQSEPHMRHTSKESSRGKSKQMKNMISLYFIVKKNRTNAKIVKYDLLIKGPQQAVNGPQLGFLRIQLACKGPQINFDVQLACKGPQINLNVPILVFSSVFFLGGLHTSLSVRKRLPDLPNLVTLRTRIQFTLVPHMRFSFPRPGCILDISLGGFQPLLSRVKI